MEMDWAHFKETLALYKRMYLIGTPKMLEGEDEQQKLGEGQEKRK
jgi:hypothetical protein